MFVLLFVYVFGGAIHIPGGPLRRLPDARHLRADRRLRRHEHRGRAWPRTCTKGLIERFRALPDGPLGRAGRAHHGGPRAQRLRGDPHHRRRLRRGLPHLRPTSGCFLLRRADRALLQLHALLGLRRRSDSRRRTRRRRRPWCSRSSSRCIFASSAFVPVRAMPGWLQASPSTSRSPRSSTPARSLMVGGTLQDTGAIWASLAWCFGLLIVLVPLAVRKYRRVA